MLREALRYPFRGSTRFDTVLVGGGLQLAAAFLPVLPLVFALGYLVRVLEHTAAEGGDAFRGDAAPPRFRPVWPLFRSGLGAGVVLAAFLAPPTLVLFATVSVLAGGTTDGRIGGLFFLVGSTAALCTALAALYPLPAALTAYASTGRIRAAVDARVLRRAVADARYFYAAVVGFVLLGLAVAVFAPLNAIAAGFFVAFAVEVVVAALWGRAAAPAVARAGDRTERP
ncbi:DUF4013 domain-containing protein [Haloferacaceae archaeon DSL9]